MSFEESIASARPVRLYLFQRGESLYWGYTNADRDITLDGYVYEAQAISDDGIRQSGEPSNDVLKITVPASNVVASMYKGTQPSEEIELTVRDVDYHNLNDYLVVWVGSIASVSLPQVDRAEINCTSLEASLERNGLTRTYNRNCDYAIYTPGRCNLNKTLYAVPATITAMDGEAIVCTLQATPRHSLAYGFAEWPVFNGLATERRGIDHVEGERIIMLGGTGGLSVGQAITLYPGCDQSSATCDGVYHNIINYGGFRHLPGKSPFDGDPIA